MLNRVILIGRLTRDPEVRFLPSGIQVTSLSIAVSRNFKDKNGEWREETSFFDIESYGKLAERVGSQLSKGYQILIEGSLRQDRWESSSGEKRSKVKIVADRIALLGKPGDRNTKSTSTDEDLDIPVEDFESDEDIPF
ncbi:single-stranded DNA-binding protein [Sulfurihydrogenibium yellowstonense]|uniref:Single-stranded DNA-binding protein n=1 Tax=Sulfurihydrogenibium yellowstonense SS-5 TaxID=432331 RepID=C4FLT5_9AQUI|nr:single-stranded DNA-binding protein [Sulfurihydrogenibium yellowstonense]EEP59967.1 single-strand binding protein family protein [Sulfurihydrogenibium yellowstonense SS-5]